MSYWTRWPSRGNPYHDELGRFTTSTNAVRSGGIDSALYRSGVDRDSAVYRTPRSKPKVDPDSALFTPSERRYITPPSRGMGGPWLDKKRRGY